MQLETIYQRKCNHEIKIECKYFIINFKNVLKQELLLLIGQINLHHTHHLRKSWIYSLLVLISHCIYLQQGIGE